jgi:hypothetical protein
MRVLIAFLLSTTLSFGQKVVVDQSEEIFKGMKRAGLHTVLVLEKDQIEKDWVKKLREYGRVTGFITEYVVDAANVPSISETPLKFYSRVSQTAAGTKIWWAVDLGTEFITKTSVKYKEAEKILHDFGVAMYMEDINDQIKDAEDAVKSASDMELKKGREAEKLAREKEKNIQEKLKLLEELKENKADSVQTANEIVQNKLDQKAAAAETDKMKQALEIVRAKLLKVE